MTPSVATSCVAESAVGLGKPERFFDQKNFSFEAQANSPANVKVNPGDVIRTRCTWKNPTDLPVVFGENTDNEMCFGFVGLLPKDPALSLGRALARRRVCPRALSGHRIPHV